jgi:hypothetical protein
MKKIILLSISAALPLLLSGCTSSRWQVRQAEYSYRSKDDPNEYSTRNTLLLDSRTGKTWIMLPNDPNEAGSYHWEEMKR